MQCAAETTPAPQPSRAGPNRSGRRWLALCWRRRQLEHRRSPGLWTNRSLRSQRLEVDRVEGHPNRCPGCPCPGRRAGTGRSRTVPEPCSGTRPRGSTLMDVAGIWMSGTFGSRLRGDVHGEAEVDLDWSEIGRSRPVMLTGSGFAPPQPATASSAAIAKSECAKCSDFLEVRVPFACTRPCSGPPRSARLHRAAGACDHAAGDDLPERREALSVQPGIVLEVDEHLGGACEFGDPGRERGCCRARCSASLSSGMRATGRHAGETSNHR